MKRLSITFGAILLVLGCFAFSPAAKAEPPIVGLWDVHYTSNYIGPWLETYDQWHSDGQEFEVGSLTPGMLCQGTWKQLPRETVQLFHVGWTYGDPPGTFRFEETQTNTVTQDHNSYDGTYDTKFYDENGNLVLEDTGTLHATRLSVNQSVTTAIK